MTREMKQLMALGAMRMVYVESSHSLLSIIDKAFTDDHQKSHLKALVNGQKLNLHEFMQLVDNEVRGTIMNWVFDNYEYPKISEMVTEYKIK